MSRVYNFSAGPAVLPEEVLKEAAAGLWNVGYGNESPFIGVPGDY